MTLVELEFLLSHFDEKKRFIEDGYYRLRTSDVDEYELAFLVADACGTTAINPQITLKVEGERITPRVLIDLATTPTKYIHYAAETSAELETALSELVAKFYQASQKLV